LDQQTANLFRSIVALGELTNDHMNQSKLIQSQPVLFHFLLLVNHTVPFKLLIEASTPREVSSASAALYATVILRTKKDFLRRPGQRYVKWLERIAFERLELMRNNPDGLRSLEHVSHDKEAGFRSGQAYADTFTVSSKFLQELLQTKKTKNRVFQFGPSVDVRNILLPFLPAHGYGLKVKRILCQPGQLVVQDQVLILLTCAGIEIAVKSMYAGMLLSIGLSEGEAVSSGQIAGLIRLHSPKA